jgi:hypothetical protein
MFYKKNRAKCTNCDDVIESESITAWTECSCGCLRIRGGSAFLERNCAPGKFKELSVIEFPPDLNFREDITPQGPPPMPPGIRK